VVFSFKTSDVSNDLIDFSSICKHCEPVLIASVQGFEYLPFGDLNDPFSSLLATNTYNNVRVKGAIAQFYIHG
jgi:hypothetical protein